MTSGANPGTGPLTREQTEAIEATLLPTLDRHHLRLQAHCLATFQQMASPLQQGPLPNRQRWQCWCEQQPQLVDDPDFVELLMMQFTAIATQLEDLASGLGISPLELRLEDLIRHSETASRQRLESSV